MKIAALVSGGVDSSVALRLLQQEGHDITAFYLKVWLEDELDFLGHCPWEEDLEFVRAVCDQAGVPLEVIALQHDYRERIVSYTIEEIRRGYTPNPDVMCNNRIKFGAFFEAIGNDFDRIATGHYARTAPDPEGSGQVHLLRAPDPVKDQTYFLAHLYQDQVARALFPIGAYQKAEVRELARKFDLPNQARKDSQGLCFLGKISFADFIKYHLGSQTGDIVEYETGQKLGEHDGFWFHTIGQRKGLRLSGGPWYVVAKDTDANVVFISRNYFSREKARNAFSISRTSWISGRPPETESARRLQVKVRHGEKLYDCALQKTGEDTYSVTLDERDQGIAPGQFAVFYDGERCLGCGAIEEETIDSQVPAPTPAVESGAPR